jgi:pterin-4a-carbinolamine dehydratase
MSVEKSAPPSRPGPQVPPGSFKAERVQLRPGENLPARLEARRVHEELCALPWWRLNPSQSALYRTFRFPASGSSLAFVRLVTAIAAELGHSTTVRLTGALVTCRLSTPRVGGITSKDIELARRISLLG